MVKYLNQNLGVKTTIKRLYKTKETKNKRKDGKLEVRIIGARMYLLSNLTNGPIICEPNFTSWRSAIDEVLKIANHLPKGKMILGNQKISNKCYTFR